MKKDLDKQRVVALPRTGLTRSASTERLPSAAATAAAAATTRR